MTLSSRNTLSTGAPASGRRAPGAAGRLLFAASLALAALSAPAAAAAAGNVVPPAVPGTIAVPAGHRAFLISHAIGTQNYLCMPRPNGTLGWSFVGPQATLFEVDLEQEMTHYLSVNPEEDIARPTWRDSRDSSIVWANPIGDPAPVSPDAIPWLLLQVVGKQDWSDGDRLAKTTYIQRVNTVGGLAPAGDCPRLGARAFVPYAAEYVFYRAGN